MGAEDMFVFSPDSGEYYQPLDVESMKCAPQILYIATAFRHNLAATSSTVTLPFTLVWSGICDKRFHSLRLAEILREKARLIRLGADETISESREQGLATLANRLLEEEIHLKEDIYGNEVFDVLNSHLGHDDFCKGAKELLRQTTVLLWGAIEVLVRDLHAEIVGPEMKGIKTALKALFKSEMDQQSLMKDLGIWILYQERHLIVHCRSVVDKKYIEATGENLPVGSELIIDAKRFEQRFREVRDAGIRIMQAARALG